MESKMNGNYQSKTTNPHSMNHSDPTKEKTGFTPISAHQSRDQDASTKFFTSSTHKSLSDAISRITKNQSSNCTPKVEENGALDEETVKLIAKVSSEEIKKHYPDKLTYEDALEHIKSSSKKRPHLVRVLEMRNGNSKDKELRRLASLFPTHFSNRTASNLTHFEIMCNEASMQICQAHPTLLTTGREERLKIAQFVVNKTNKLLLSSTDKNLAGMSNNSFSEEQLTTKLNEIRSQIDAFKLKMSEAETNKNYVTVLEYQSELARLGFKEKAIISLQKKTSK
uniref:NAB co-repressor domain-containing protein n=1 Tax=Ciona savignyi TaxID=51511 RepID=H2YF88_CIOSA